MLRSHMKPPFRSARRSRLFKLNDPRNGARKPAPVICFFFELSPPEPRERIIFCAPTILGRSPFGCDPALLLQLVQRRVQRSVAHLQNVAGHLRSEEHTSELQSRGHLVCRLLLEKKKNKKIQ